MVPEGCTLGVVLGVFGVLAVVVVPAPAGGVFMAGMGVLVFGGVAGMLLLVMVVPAGAGVVPTLPVVGGVMLGGGTVLPGEAVAPAGVALACVLPGGGGVVLLAGIVMLLAGDVPLGGVVALAVCWPDKSCHSRSPMSQACRAWSKAACLSVSMSFGSILGGSFSIAASAALYVFSFLAKNCSKSALVMGPVACSWSGGSGAGGSVRDPCAVVFCPGVLLVGAGTPPEDCPGAGVLVSTFAVCGSGLGVPVGVWAIGMACKKSMSGQPGPGPIPKLVALDGDETCVVPMRTAI